MQAGERAPTPRSSSSQPPTPTPRHASRAWAPSAQPVPADITFRSARARGGSNGVPEPPKAGRPPPSVVSGTPAACTHSPILKTNRRRRLPAAFAGLPPACASLSWEVCWQGPGGTCRLSPPLADGAETSVHPAPVLSDSRALSLPSSHPQSCDAVSGLHGSDSSVELTAWKKKRGREATTKEDDSGVLQRIAQLKAGCTECPAASRRAQHREEQEPALPLHQHHCLGAASQPAGPAPPTSCDQIRPRKASLNLRGRPGLGISSGPHLYSGVGCHPPPAQAGAPLALLEPTSHVARSLHTKESMEYRAPVPRSCLLRKKDSRRKSSLAGPHPLGPSEGTVWHFKGFLTNNSAL
ncbi:uncharacterized protein LOC101722481 [Heterocephalus glaber]|uniref:Uncharacterized protein LOC101722481 n=1 Tax=Heterocephalus glaber TaxID=10181 RepID=A0AAX6QLF6_HETGA|nr:uncharacterized protein LOC101722481 [Heterocephalus glaber]